jgi:GAG-pre-integrase domain/Integrase core domain
MYVKRREPFFSLFTQVHASTHSLSLIPSILPRFVTRSFFAVRSPPQPCTPILRAPRAHIPFPDPVESSTRAMDFCFHLRESSLSQDVDTWHRRLGHTGTHKIRSMLRTGRLSPIQNTVPCNECILGKRHRHPFPGSVATATRPGDVIHSDVVGPLPPSHSDSCYLVAYVDELTRYVTNFALVRKSAVLDSFKIFHREFERLHKNTIKAIYSDNGGGEYAPVAKYALQLGVSVIALPRILHSPMVSQSAKIDRYSKWLVIH